MNKLMGAEYNRVLRAIAEHDRIIIDASASQEAKTAAVELRDELVEGWPRKLKASEAQLPRMLRACVELTPC